MYAAWSPSTPDHGDPAAVPPLGAVFCETVRCSIEAIQRDNLQGCTIIVGIWTTPGIGKHPQVCESVPNVPRVTAVGDDGTKRRSSGQQSTTHKPNRKTKHRTIAQPGEASLRLIFARMARDPY
ncbi:hypothetical protein Sjap_018220 [Stephania japonica]|uniref:Uncharacterized protein n=1 Tax=Stephania japonica TaxID=461633 RepID=A0AAP0I7Q0_9MAGN